MLLLSPESEAPVTGSTTRHVVRKIDGLPPDTGAEALRERLRIFSTGSRTRNLVVPPREIVLALRELDALRSACQAAGAAPQPIETKNRKGRRLEVEDDSGREKPVQGRKPVLVRFRPEVACAVEAFAAKRGGRSAWSFSRAVNEILASALAAGASS